MQCTICENTCSIEEHGTGTCGMYTIDGGIQVEKYPDRYLVAVRSEVESMPMLHYHPGGKFLQVCTIGCNFRCDGCVSWVLTESVDAIEGALYGMTPEQVVTRALDEGCRGVMFCFNEPAVSFFTFKKVAVLARERKLLVGCATNGYFTEQAFRELLEHIDFINIGIKGCSDETYAGFGASSAAPVFRNLKLGVERGVFTEVAAVYVKGHEREVLETAERVAAISRDIPFQIMRFIPLAAADVSLEPTIREAEALCDEIKRLLTYAYLFNSPGTRHLNTWCPECGELIVRRGFNGPMCAHVTDYREDGTCSCGFRPPFAGTFEEAGGAEVLGFNGGYKVVYTLESIQTVLAFLGERDPRVIASVLRQILATGFIEGLYQRTKQIGGYLDTVDHYAKLAGRTAEARGLREYVEHYVSVIGDAAGDVDRPSVYFALGHPLVAVFGDKFECKLVELAGGRCVNKELERDETPGMTIAEETLTRLNPDIILITGAMDYPAGDLHDYCVKQGLDVKAVRDGKIYNLYPYNTAGRPDWILGLMRMANIIHPELFGFRMDDLADEFYERFLGVKLHSARRSRSIAHPEVLKQAAH